MISHITKLKILEKITERKDIAILCEVQIPEIYNNIFSHTKRIQEGNPIGMKSLMQCTGTSITNELTLQAKKIRITFSCHKL